MPKKTKTSHRQRSLPPVVTAHLATSRIKIDGKLNEPDWQQAEIVKDFFRMEPLQGVSYLYDTKVRLLYDEKNLYAGAFCKDSLGRKGVRVQDLRRDFSWGENDIFFVQLDPQNLKQYYISFQTTPYGDQRDMQAFNDQNYDNDWNALWSVFALIARILVTMRRVCHPFQIHSLSRNNSDEPPTWGITFSRLAR